MAAEPPRVVVFGSINIDLICRVDAIPAPGETVLAESYSQAFGGKGANQAVAAARALGAVGCVEMVGAVGDDPLGAQAIENLAREGIATEAVARLGAPTGCAFINVSRDGENAITVASGANARVAAGQLPPLTGDTVVVMQMETPAAENLQVARRARAAGARLLINLAPARTGDDRDVIRDLLRAGGVLVVNEHELRVAAELAGRPSTDGIRDACRAVSAAIGGAVVATAGAGGAYLSEHGGAARHVPAVKVEVRDTTGAGDCLGGVLAAGLAEGLDLSAALRRAVVAASLACEEVGAQASMPAREQLACRS